MDRTRWIIPALSLIPAVAAADVVYLTNGKRYEGVVTRDGDKVTVKMTFATLTFDAKDVIAVKKAPVRRRPEATGPGATDLAVPGRRFTIADATEPEPIVFVHMRSLMVAAPGADSEDIRRRIERWRIAAHDRKRKAGLKWLSPADFARRRKAYLKHLEEAREYLRKSVKRGSSKPQTAEQRRSYAAGMSRLHAAAKSWADPPLRVFLLGALAYQQGRYAAAEEYFASCCKALPRIAMFHQGRGMALLAGGRPLDALGEFIKLARLRPDDRDAVLTLKDAMAKVPGRQTRSETYRAAERLLGEYDPARLGRRTTRRGIKWLAPGKPWTVRDGTLPVPTVDRFVFRQAVGVPVGPHALLVDARAVAGALAVHVRIDAETLVPAKAGRVGSSGATTRELALVTVAGIEFTPVAADIEKKDKDRAGPKPCPAEGQPVMAYGLGAYEQMGQTVRKIRGTITKVAPEGPIRVSPRLLPGEAAGPVVTDDNRLVGFLAARTAVRQAGGGPDRLIPLEHMRQLIRRGRRSSSPSGYRRVRRKAAAAEVAGGFFIVYGTFGEIFER